MKRVGLIIPSVNTVVEDEVLVRLSPHVHPHVTRLRMTGPHRRPLDEVLPAIEEASALLVDAGCELVVFHCTANSTENGEDGESRILAALARGGAAQVSSTATALKRALAAIGGRRIALVTPYTQEVTEHETHFLGEIGQDAIYAKGCDVGRLDYASTSVDYWIARLGEARSSDADVYFLSCANIQSIGAIEPAEALLNRPVITSNQVIVWDTMTRLLGAARAKGPGRLFTMDKEG